MNTLIAALQQQRNQALDACAMLAAELEATKQRIKELESKKEATQTPAERAGF